MKTAQEFLNDEEYYSVENSEDVRQAMKDYAIYIANYAYNQGVTEIVTNTVNKSAYSQKLYNEL